MRTPTYISLPPLPIREGYKDGEFYLEMDDETVETFPDVFARLARKVEIENAYNKALNEIVVEYNL